MWWAITILTIIISLFTSITLFYALKRINQYEAVLIKIQGVINYSSQKMKVLDEKGSFESDDEVGFFFEELKNIQSILNNLFDNEDNEEIKDAKKKS